MKAELNNLIELAHIAGRQEAKADFMEKLADMVKKNPELNVFTVDQIVELIKKL